MLLNSIPVIPLWVGILLVTCGAAAVIFAKPFAVRALGLIVVAVGVMVCYTHQTMRLQHYRLRQAQPKDGGK
jgi:hypothetical protein